MNFKIKLFLICTLTGANSFLANSQNQNEGHVSGNVQMIFQEYNPDSIIGAQVPPAKAAMNSFANINYVKGNFRAGTRFESYLNAQLGYPDRFSGTGIGYRYAGYTLDGLDITVGNFYDQFGNGLVFRAYEERQLGIDNAMDGIRIAYKPMDGMYVKAVYGKMRYTFNNGTVNADGIVRGIDGEIQLNELIKKLEDSKAIISMGGSFVSKYQQDDNPAYNLPENVGAWSGRTNIMYGNFSINGEYAYKINDPSADNKYIYKPGQALLVNTTYAQKGLSISLDAKYVDNMSYRADRNAILTDLNINFLPALTKPHTYNLAATLYPYATQPTGEVAYQGEISYNFKKGTPLGGKYGTQITVNASAAFSMDSTTITDADPQLQGYTANFMIPGDQLYYQDIHVELKKKINKKWSFVLMYLNLAYDNDINQGAYDNQGKATKGSIFSQIYIADISYKIDNKNNIRMELQNLNTNQHLGDWGTIVIEYTKSPHWFVAFMDQWNYGNKNADERVHYLYGTVGYIKNANRFSIGYGKQRAGLFCVGGICRTVPASNGLTFSLTSSF
jgi:hypothetical protein